MRGVDRLRAMLKDPVKRARVETILANGGTSRDVAENIRMRRSEARQALEEAGMVGPVGEFDWNADAEALACRMWVSERKTGTEIARRLGGGLTRNAVYGKLEWLGVRFRRPKRGKSASLGPRLAQAPGKPLPDLAAIDEEALELEDGSHITLETLVRGRMCAYPIGDPLEEDFHYCGRPPRSKADGGGDYCAAHARRCFTGTAREAMRKGSAGAPMVMNGAPWAR